MAAESETLQSQPEDPSLLPWRAYRVVRAQRFLLAFWVCVIAITMVVVATAKSLSLGQIVTLVAIDGVCGGYALYNAFHFGVKESASGLSWFLYVTHTRVAWEQIRKVEVTRVGISRALLIRCEGRRNGIAPLTQGKRVVWHGGGTNDIVSVLTDRVNQVRASRGLAPIE
jgi:hypothetical protein